MKLSISRITDPSDFKYTVPIEFAAFHADGGHNAMFGSPNSTTIAHLVDHHAKNLSKDPADCWMKITDDEADGRIVCVSWWKIYPSFVAAEYEKRWREVEVLTPGDFSFLEGEGEGRCEAAEKVVKLFLGKRFERIKEAHCHLQLLFTDPAYHGKGAGRMMLQWGTRLADHLRIPIWVETSKEGARLYDSFGFERIEEVYLKLEAPMRPIEYPLRRRPVKPADL